MNKKIFRLVCILILLIFVCSTTPILAQAKDSSKVKPYSYLKYNIAKIYSGKNLIYHGAAIGLTYLIVESKLDAKVFDYARQQEANHLIGGLVYTGGSIMPFALPLSMYLFTKNKKIRNGSFAVMQAAVIASATNTVLKTFTGRINPQLDGSDSYLMSKKWRFGFLRGGVHNGWPSAHAAINTAIGMALASYFKDSPVIQTLGVAWALFITSHVAFVEKGTGHWFSDAVAGGLMGTAIGLTTGKTFRLNYNNSQISFHSTFINGSIQPGIRIQF